MKSIGIGLLAIFLLWSCDSDKAIGKKSGNEYKLTTRFADSLTSAWNNILSEEKLSTVITDLVVVKDNDLAGKETYYAILGKTLGDSTKLACIVMLRDEKIYLPESEVKTIIVCYGSTNCQPKMYNSKWVCDDGSGKASCSLDCNKKSIASINTKD